MNQVISVISAKGGTGKTTSSAAILQCAIKDGKRTLGIDLDPQSSLSYWFKADMSHYNSYDLLQGANIADVIQTTESGIDIICAHSDLSGIKTAPGSARRLEKSLQAIKGKYDLIVIDTAPAIGELQNSALFASDEVLIPLQADALSLQALYQVMDIIKHTQANKDGLNVLGVVITQFESRTNLRQFMRDTIKEKCEELNCNYLGEIRKSIAACESLAFQKSLYDYAPRSTAAMDYKRLYDSIMQNI